MIYNEVFLNDDILTDRKLPKANSDVYYTFYLISV